MQKAVRKAAIILSGCGRNDGRELQERFYFSEVTETVSFFISLSNKGFQYDCFAPNTDQFDVINPINGEKMEEKRNVMIESSRISRGSIKDLKDLEANDYHALLIPGGFGAAKNLSTFAVDNDKLKVVQGVSKALDSFHKQKKPIALCCIAPIIAAKVFEGKGVKLTLGDKGDCWPHTGAIDAAEKLGNKMQLKGVLDFALDQQNLILTTPAFMKGDATAHQVFEGISKMVERLSEMC